MISYTQEEIKKLYDLIDIRKHNVNMTFKPGECSLSSSWVPGLSEKQAMDRALRFIIHEEARSMLHDFIYETPLDEMPLHINDQDSRALIAKWRMSISK